VPKSEFRKLRLPFILALFFMEVDMQETMKKTTTDRAEYHDLGTLIFNILGDFSNSFPLYVESLPFVRAGVKMIFKIKKSLADHDSPHLSPV
jgi:hypothetical protein